MQKHILCERPLMGGSMFSHSCCDWESLVVVLVHCDGTDGSLRSLWSEMESSASVCVRVYVCTSVCVLTGLRFGPVAAVPPSPSMPSVWHQWP